MVTVLRKTEKEIMAIVKKHGEYSLSWHYRVDPTRDRCFALVKKGMLKRVRSSRGVDVWQITELGKSTPLPTNHSYPRIFVGKWGERQKQSRLAQL
jgi:hypothetical protein